VRVSHEHTAVFDDPNLVSCAGLAPGLTLADRAGLHEHLDRHLMLARPGAANAAVKATSLVAGMVVGADSIHDMDVLRHGAMARLFGGARAPSTLGTFLRTFTFGHVRQLDAVAARTLAGLAARTPLLVGAAQVAYVDVNDTVKQTYGYAKHGRLIVRRVRRLNPTNRHAGAEQGELLPASTGWLSQLGSSRSPWRATSCSPKTSSSRSQPSSPGPAPGSHCCGCGR